MMPNLQLSLVEGGSDGQLSAFEITQTGATIGRSRECDWVLHDPDRFISNKHVLISFKENAFVLSDLSSNGVFINGEQQAVGSGNIYTLREHDTITLGKFTLRVTQLTISKASSAGDFSSNLASDFSVSASSESSLASSSANGLGLFDILNADPATAASASNQAQSIAPQALTDSTIDTVSNTHAPHTQPSTYFADQATTFPSDSSSAAIPPVIKSAEMQSAMIPDDWDVQIESNPSLGESQEHVHLAEECKPLVDAQLQAQSQSQPQHKEQVQLPANVQAHVQPPLQVAESGGQQAENAPISQDESGFFKHLYARLGLPKEYRDSVDQEVFVEDLVNILTTSTQGIMGLLAGRSVFKQESRLNMTMIKPQSNNPIKFALDPSDTLEMLLVKKKPGYMSAQASYSEALNDIQAHQMAFLNGLQATLSGVLAQLEPDAIAKEIEHKSASFMGLKSSNKKWQHYVDKQTLLQKQVSENLNDILATHFSPAYEQYINKAGKPNE